MRIKKFAYLPTIAFTWRSSCSRSIIWLQPYILNDETNEKEIRKLGFFSYEFVGRLISDETKSGLLFIAFLLGIAYLIIG